MSRSVQLGAYAEGRQSALEQALRVAEEVAKQQKSHDAVQRAIEVVAALRRLLEER